MYTIETQTRTTASLSILLTALTTREGFRGWLAVDTREDAANRYTFPFGPRVVTFTVDRADDRGVTMTCVDHQDNPDWLGTTLTITLTPLSDGTSRIDLVHTGYASKNECYTRCIGAWDHFVASLAAYAATGKGMPFETNVAAAPARSTGVSAQVAS